MTNKPKREWEKPNKPTKEILNHYEQALKNRKMFLREQVKLSDLFGDNEWIENHKRSLYSQIGWITRKLNYLK